MKKTFYKYCMFVVMVLAMFTRFYANTSIPNYQLRLEQQQASQTQENLDKTEVSALPDDGLLNLDKAVTELIEAEEVDHQADQDAMQLHPNALASMFFHAIFWSQSFNLKSNKRFPVWSITQPTCKKYIQFEVFRI